MAMGNEGTALKRLDRWTGTAAVGRRHNLKWVAGAAALLMASGCSRSQFVSATIENDTAEKLSIIEIDYPNASFGVSVLAPHASYSYRFKPQGTGALQLSYTDGTGKPHSAAGPQVHEGQGGRISVHIEDHAKDTWSATP
jgi:hypothetical protein